MAVLQLYAERKAAKRRKLLLACQFRYRQMIIKWRQAVIRNKRIDGTVIWFARWLRVLSSKMAISVQFHWKKVQKDLKKKLTEWRQYSVKKRNNRELLQTLAEYKQSSIVHKAFNDMKQNCVFSRNLRQFLHKKNSTREYNALRCLRQYKDSRNLKTQTKIHVDAVYQQRLIMKCIDNWMQGCKSADYQDYYVFLKQKTILRAWRDLSTKQAQTSLEQALHLRNKSLLRYHFSLLAQSVENAKLSKTARKFRLFQLFHAFFLRVQIKQQNKYKNLKAMEFHRTVHAQMVLRSAFKNLQKAVQESQSDRYKEEAVSSYYASKEKERLIQETFWRLKMSCRYQKIERMRKVRLLRRAMIGWKMFRQEAMQTKKAIVQRILHKKWQLISTAFLALKILLSQRASREAMADLYYSKKAQKKWLYKWLEGIVSDYIIKCQIADNYREKRLCYAGVLGLKLHSDLERKKREFIARRKYQLMRQAYVKLKAVVIAELKRKKRNYDLVHAVFYHWRLTLKLQTIF